MISSTFILCDEIIPPYSFDYQLENYVIPPEKRIDNTLLNAMRLGQQTVLVKVSSSGTVQKPILTLEVWSPNALQDWEIMYLKQSVDRWLGLSDDLKPFYDQISDDPVMRTAIEMRYGAKDKANFTPFEAIISTVCAQNVIFKRLYGMMDNLCNQLGDKVSLDGITYSAFPTPHTLATCSLEQLRACKVGYRAEYIQSIADAVDTGLINLTDIDQSPYEVARQRLMTLHGVGPYTADLCLILAFRRKDVLHLDLYVREALWQFYFNGKQVPDNVLREVASERWPSYQTWAVGMLTTNTEELAIRLGKSFRLKSGARQ